MKQMTPTLHCDGNYGFCTEWELDYYALNVTAVARTVITSTERAPGWLSTDNGDWCPTHS